jgi:phosphoheptose isomerase
MNRSIEYIVDEQGNKVKAIISLDMLSKIMKKKRMLSKGLTKDKIVMYAGSIKLNTDAIKYQTELRNEWK